MKKVWNWIKNHLPTRRKLIQVYAALLFNANLKGYIKGEIYKGPLKNICTPGLNCYSCPGASGACPLGALQNSLAASTARAPYFMFGIIALYGLMFGRWICGFLCPFGLIQELLHKIPTPKLRKSRVTRALSYLKYVIPVFFVFLVPIAYAFRSFPLPGFCKYICPAGTLEGAMGLLSNAVNESYLRMPGPLFTWKFLLMVSILVACVFIFRGFCRFICPLGALYGFFNRISLVGVKIEPHSCTDCGLCTAKCKMDVKHVGDRECIQCGECMDVCPTGAIQWKGSKLFLAPNAIEVAEDASAEEKEAARVANEERNAKIKKRNNVIKYAVAGAMAILLAVTLVYYNFMDGREDTPPASDDPVVGTTVGSICPNLTLDVLESDTDFVLENERGRVTVLNFWYTTCGPCVEELPHFNEVASEYADRVSVIALHINIPGTEVIYWIEDNHPEWLEGEMLIAYDNGATVQKLFGVQACPVTVVINGEGEITDVFMGSITRAELIAAVDKALSE